MDYNWHTLSIEETVSALSGDIDQGLTNEEALKRRKQTGANLLPKERPFSKARIFLEQFQSPLIYILVIAGIIVLFLQHYADAIVIFGAVILNTVIGFVQENKASQMLQKLKYVIKYQTKVIRKGDIKIIDPSELVPGDIFLVEAGEKVPADARILEAKNLKTNEMVLTGEWLPALKNLERLPQDTPLADKDNMIYMGTIVESGRAKAIITATGKNTEIGKLAVMVRETKEEKTPYQRKLAHFARIVALIVGVIALGIFIQGIIIEQDFIKMFTTAVAVAVAAIPEGLPAAMTVVLALGMQRVLKKKGLVRKLAAAETLGSTSIICTDKTGTLTQGKIKVTKVLSPAQIFNKKTSAKTKDLIYKTAVLCNGGWVENENKPKREWIIRGEPTDRAILSFGIKKGFSKKELLSKLPKLDELSFDSKRKFLSSLHKDKKNNLLLVSGAPEKIIEFSLLDSVKKRKWEEATRNIASRGFRVIAFAYKHTGEKKIKKSLFSNLEMLALVRLEDPLRPDVKQAIDTCRRAGMKTIIVTGDHKLTACAIAQQIGLSITEEAVIEGRELDKLSNAQFKKNLSNIQIYARAEPRHKNRIIKAWQEAGEVVAMTGDGINDTPALKRADIGVSLGSGTEAAKETSDLVLLNNNFSVIVAAVEEGRAILDNIRKVITYLFASGFTEIILIGGTMAMAVILKEPWILPVTAVQILWINLIEDGLPSMSLAFEKKEPDLMSKNPDKKSASLLTREMKAIIFVIGIVTDIMLLGVFYWLRNSGIAIARIRTMIFVALAIDSLFYVFACRSLRKGVLSINLFGNKLLIVAWLLSFLALIAAIYAPILNSLLATVPLSTGEWAILIFLGFVKVSLIELAKHYFIIRCKA
jgi:P-type Ca2+ transporter type 2C